MKEPLPLFILYILLFTLRQIHETHPNTSINLYNLYVDYQRAFDGVNRSQMINDLGLLATPFDTLLVYMTLIRLTSATLRVSKAEVKVNKE